MEGAIKHSAEKQPDTTQTLTLTRQRHKTGMDIPLRGCRGAQAAPLQKNQSMFSTEPIFFTFLRKFYLQNQKMSVYLNYTYTEHKDFLQV